jgi:regulator of replication initiation timing
MIDELTDAEKIEWLWNKLDSMNAENASLRADLERTESENKRLKLDLENIREAANRSDMEIVRLANIVNKAKQDSANAVRDYISMSEGREV